MQYVRLLSVQGGLYEPNTNISQNLASVKVLHLNHLDINVLVQMNGPNIVYVNLSHNRIHTVKINAFDFMINIKILSLMSNNLQSLESYVCSKLKYLEYLYLSDNPLIHVASDVFLENPRLTIIRSDLYMVCCVAIQTEDCQPQNQFVSSCSNLISSSAQRIITIIQGIIVLIGNIGAIIVQFVFHGNRAQRYLIVSFAVADLMMGIYLLVISYIDIIYTKIFFQIVSELTSSYYCIIFGLINYMSCEMSLMILRILSVARLISIKKPHGMTSFETK